MTDNHTETASAEPAPADALDRPDKASRLLARAARAALLRPVYDIEKLRAAFEEFADEELALAESDLEHRLALLEDEDRF